MNKKIIIFLTDYRFLPKMQFNPVAKQEKAIIILCLTIKSSTTKPISKRFNDGNTRKAYRTINLKRSSPIENTMGFVNGNNESINKLKRKKILTSALIRIKDSLSRFYSFSLYFYMYFDLLSKKNAYELHQIQHIC